MAERNTHPYITQTFWNAICFNNFQADQDMLIQYLQQKISCTESQAEEYFTQALNDNLICEFKTETGQVFYKRVSEIEKIPSHDWYCIECHQAGDVQPCTNCTRVFHEKCTNKGQAKIDKFNIKGEMQPNDYDSNLCSTCNLFKMKADEFSDTEECNHILSFLYERIKPWVPLNIVNSLSPDTQPKWLTEEELISRGEFLFFEKMTYPILEEKIFSKKYTRLFEFYRDVEVMAHNIAIFHGGDSQEYGAAEMMLDDCTYDIKEVINCVDCYKFSNEKSNNDWFCTPCRIPHKLVWAKQKGYPYWPAKVMRETEEGIDVRFFGGKYERSVLPVINIKPIETNIHSLQLKESSALIKALDELRMHQKLLNSDYIVPKIFGKKYKKSVHRSSQERNAADVAAFFNNAKRNSSERSSEENNQEPTVTPPKKIRNDAEAGNSSEIAIDPIDLKIKPICEETISSTQCHKIGEASSSSSQYTPCVERMKEKLEICKDKRTLIATAVDHMQEETERLINQHREEIRQLTESYTAQIAETKKRQWCFNCGEDAMYHCCWNTAYCSQACQQQHWQEEHKRNCRRKRN